jgi:DNA-binding NarL/FixJ family response regulator
VIKVLIAHRSPVFRRGLRSLLQETADMQIVDDAGSIEAALMLSKSTHPDVVLLDSMLTAKLPVLTALDLVAHLHKDGIRGLFVFAPPADTVEEILLFQFLKCGAMACELPHLDDACLLEKIRQVASGQSVISSAILTPAKRVPIKPAPDQPETACILSVREIAILKEIIRGLSNKQIAQSLKISDQTVKNHVTSILKKLDVRDRTSAVVTALLLGVISLQDVSGQGEPRKPPAEASLEEHALSLAETL